MAVKFRPRWYIDTCKVVFMVTVLLNLGCVVAFDYTTNPSIGQILTGKDNLKEFVKTVVHTPADTRPPKNIK